MRLDQLGQSVIDLLPDFARHHRFERRGRDFELEIAGAAVAGVDDPDFSLSPRRPPPPFPSPQAGEGWGGGGPLPLSPKGRRGVLGAGADQETGDQLDRLLGGGEADAQQRLLAEGCEALQRKGQVGTALIRCKRMDLVDDHRARRRQHFAAGSGAEQDVERFRRGHDDVRRGAPHALALARRRVAGAHPAADLDIRQSLGAQGFAYTGERDLQIAPDVVRQRLQRRDVNDLRLILQLARQPLPHQPVDRRQKGGKRLARPGWRRNQHMPAGPDRWPCLGLCRCRRREAAVEPGGDSGVKQGGGVHDWHLCVALLGDKSLFAMAMRTNPG